MTRRVHAVGYYGWDNFGDELFRAAVTHNRELLWGEDSKVRFFVTPNRRMHQSTGVIGAGTRLAEALVGALWSNTVALCGGSVLQDVRGVQNIRNRILTALNKIEGLGISLGPWDSDASRTRVLDYVGRMDRVVLRDEASSLRSGGNISVGGDLAALYPMPVFPESDRQHLTICISNDSKASLDQISELLTPLLKQVDIPVKLLALNVRKNYGDVEFTQEIARRLAKENLDVEVIQFQSIDQTIDVIARSKAVWSQRLHGLIVAYLCEVPILALSHHQKIEDFAQDIGLPSEFLRKDLLPSSEMMESAAQTLNSPVELSTSPSEYKAKTIRAFSVTAGKA